MKDDEVGSFLEHNILSVCHRFRSVYTNEKCFITWCVLETKGSA